ncbi:UvrD-helicase domain-containing protein [Methylobacterium sp. CM6244]
MPNEVIVAAAGGGKTTRIVKRAAADPRRAALVTYTINNLEQLRSRFYEIGTALPAHVEIWSWYRFLLHELVRPYQLSLVKRRITGLHYVEGKSAPYAKKSDTYRYFFSDGGRLIYSDKISEFVLLLNDVSVGAVIARLAQRFSVIYIDEIQDMAGWDLDLLELLLRSGIDIVLVGEHRQATFSTNHSLKNKNFRGIKIVDKFKAWEKAKLCKLCFERETHRCHQLIANLADTFFPDEPTTISMNDKDTGHDGVFIIGKGLVEPYMDRFGPRSYG